MTRWQFDDGRGSSNRGPQDQAVSNSSSWKSNTERAHSELRTKRGGEKDVEIKIEKIDSSIYLTHTQPFKYQLSVNEIFMNNEIQYSCCSRYENVT